MVTLREKINLERMRLGRPLIEEDIPFDNDEELTEEEELAIDRVIRNLHKRLEGEVDFPFEA